MVEAQLPPMHTSKGFYSIGRPIFQLLATTTNKCSEKHLQPIYYNKLIGTHCPSYY